MNIADKKKEENICEYIIHIYRSEYLIRNFEGKIEDIEKYVISHLPVSDEEKQEQKTWYDSLISQMQTEEIMKEGHLSFVQEHVTELEALHSRLLEEDETYKGFFNVAKPDIDKNLEIADGLITSEIQICLNAMFGMLLLKMNRKPIPEDAQAMLEKFGDVLSYLSVVYKREAQA
ncbi:DUF4924 family protein [Sediminitomix flava]|nr:DUF4924 family protein [Sediminitomix flava]